MVNGDSKAKRKALELEKLLLAYEADVEAHMDGFDRMKFCYN